MEEGNQIEETEDLCRLSQLDETVVLQTLKNRYLHDDIYTNIGPILVSVNPYKILQIYSQSFMEDYSQGKMSPHLFALANRVFTKMNDERENQSIIVSGESGSGKTEATKFLLQFLSYRSVSEHSGTNAIEDQLLQSSPILEAFGNAQTARNKNSSRFGKFIQVRYNSRGSIIGANIHTYLLEKTRIVNQAPKERNYHVFYQLCRGALLEKNLQLLSPEKFHYLNQGTLTIEHVDDSQQFQILKSAFSILGCSPETQGNIFSLLAGILHLGNIVFSKRSTSDGAEIKDKQSVQTVVKILSLPNAVELEKSLCFRSFHSGRKSSYSIPLNVVNASDSRDALAKTLYSSKSHQSEIEFKDERSEFYWNFRYLWIWYLCSGVFLFILLENFDQNSFEQLLINSCNERLQQLFNVQVFKFEQVFTSQDEYQREKIGWHSIQFHDNQQCVDLVEQKQVGILATLDEECILPKGNDENYLSKLHTKFDKHPNYINIKQKLKDGFAIKHYAGDVFYLTNGFLEKNKDAFYPDLDNLMRSSTNKFIRDLFISESPKRDSTKSAKIVTVGFQFREQLSDLMSTLNSTFSHYVWCIKPNEIQSPKRFEELFVSKHLKYVGMLETIRLRQSGFAVRRKFEDFCKRYEVLGGKGQNNWKKRCEDLLKSIIPRNNPIIYTLGETMVFLKIEASNILDEARRKEVQRIEDELRLSRSLLAQTLARGYLARKKYNEILEAYYRKLEEERLRHEEEERLRREEEERLRREEEERLRWEEEERARLEAERILKEEEERFQREEEERIRLEAELQITEEEEREEEERKRHKEEEDYWEAERIRLEEEQRRVWEEEDRNKRINKSEEDIEETFDTSFAVIYNNLVNIGENLKRERESKEIGNEHVRNLEKAQETLVTSLNQMYVGPRQRTATIVMVDETHVVMETPRDTIVIEKESFDAKYKRTYQQLETVEEKLNAAQITEEGLRKLIEFYVHDPIARSKAESEYLEQQKVVQTLKETQEKLILLLNDMYYNGDVKETPIEEMSSSPSNKKEETGQKVNKESFETQYKRLYDQFLTVEEKLKKAQIAYDGILKLQQLYSNSSPEVKAKTEREIREQGQLVRTLKMALDNLQRQLTIYYEKSNKESQINLRESQASIVESVHYYNLESFQNGLKKDSQEVPESPRDRPEGKSEIGTPIPIAESKPKLSDEEKEKKSLEQHAQIEKERVMREAEQQMKQQPKNPRWGKGKLPSVRASATHLGNARKSALPIFQMNLIFQRVKEQLRLVDEQISQAEESENNMKKTAQESSQQGKNRASIEKQLWDQRQLISTLYKARDKLQAQIRDLERKMKGGDEEEEEVVTPQGRRQSVLNELINTERDYVDDLDIILKVFILPLRSKSVIPEKDITILFSNVETLVNVNREFLKNLEIRSKESIESHVGDLFQQMGDYFKMYKVFCSNYAACLQRLDELSKVSSFDNFLQQCVKDPRCRGLSLVSFLIKPVQRITKYPLLLKELLKYTPEDHPDYNLLLEAKSKIEDVVLYINEGKRAFEEQQKIMEIQNKIDGLTNLVGPARTLLKEGKVMGISPEDKVESEHHIYLFNDQFVIAAKKKENAITQVTSKFIELKPYKLRAHISLNQCRLVQCGDNPSKQYAYSFEVIPTDTNKVYKLMFTTVSEKDTWFRDIHAIVKNFQKKKMKKSESIDINKN